MVHALRHEAQGIRHFQYLNTVLQILFIDQQRRTPYIQVARNSNWFKKLSGDFKENMSGKVYINRTTLHPQLHNLSTRILNSNPKTRKRLYKYGNAEGTEPNP